MDQHRFDALARALTGASLDESQFEHLTRSLAQSRRSLLGGAIATMAGLLVATDVGAKKRRKKKQGKHDCKRNCRDRTCGNDGCGGSCGACDANQVCHGGECCVPESRGATCAGRCGTWTNNCGEPVVCATCADGQQCLGNGSCAIACTANEECSSCGCSNPNVEGEHHCISGPLQPLVTCTTTTDCPPGSHCQDLGNGGACIELCN